MSSDFQLWVSLRKPGYVNLILTGHYVENTGNTTLTYLEIFKSGEWHFKDHAVQLADLFDIDVFQDISLNQWLALTPPDLVRAHLGLSDATIKKLSKTKLTVVGST